MYVGVGGLCDWECVMVSERKIVYDSLVVCVFYTLFIIHVCLFCS